MNKFGKIEVARFNCHGQKGNFICNTTQLAGLGDEHSPDCAGRPWQFLAELWLLGKEANTTVMSVQIFAKK